MVIYVAILLAVLVVVIGSIRLYKWKLTKPVALSFIGWYVVFVIVVSVLQGTGAL